jgi:hypothetical protein
MPADYDMVDEDRLVLSEIESILGEEAKKEEAKKAPPPPPSVMDKAKDMMQQKHYGLPVWGWSLGGAALVGGLYYYLRRPRRGRR